MSPLPASPDADAPLEVRHEDGVWTFVLNRPGKLNALDAGLVDALSAAVDRAHSDRARLMVFRGAGRSFSAGFDLSRLEEQSEGDLVLRFVRIEMLLQAIARSPAQTIALAQGRIFGAGADLFAACRHRVAAPDASFRMPGLKFGLILGTRRFGEIVGADHARRVLERVGAFPAAEAAAMSFVTRLASPDEWPAIIDEVDSVARMLADETREELYRVLGPDAGRADEDLATLTRSAARPGLKERLQHYLGRQP